jgi:hypothetical protein
MAEMLLINPRRRRKASASAPKRKATKRRARRNPAPVARTRTTPTRRVRSVMRAKANPIRRKRRSSSRRRNPIGMPAGLNAKSVMSFVKDAAIGAGGAVAVDVLMAKLAPMLPASLQKNPAKPGAFEAIKAGLTILAGVTLRKASKGLSVKAAQGALVVQARDVMNKFLPASLTVAGLGYASPAMIVNRNNRIGPVRSSSMAAYQRAGGATPLLSAYQQSGGPSPLLSAAGRRSARAREGFPR